MKKIPLDSITDEIKKPLKKPNLKKNKEKIPAIIIAEKVKKETVTKQHTDIKQDNKRIKTQQQLTEFVLANLEILITTNARGNTIIVKNSVGKKYKFTYKTNIIK